MQYQIKTHVPERGSAINYLAERLVKNDVKDWQLLDNMSPAGVQRLIRDLIAAH